MVTSSNVFEFMRAGYTIEWTAANLVHLSALQSVGEPTHTSVELLVVKWTVRNHTIIEVSVQCRFMNWNCLLVLSWYLDAQRYNRKQHAQRHMLFPAFHGWSMVCIFNIVGNYEMNPKILSPCRSSPMRAWLDCWLVDWWNSGCFIAQVLYITSG